MKLGVVLHPYGEKSPGGLGRSIHEIAKHVITLGFEHRYTVYVKGKSKRPSFPGTSWEFKTLGRGPLWLTGAFGMDRTLDAYVFFTPVIPFFLRPKRSLVFVLDFAYLRFQSSWKERLSATFLLFLHRRALRKADRIIAISEQTKEETIRFCKVPAEKIAVVPLSYIPLGETKKEINVPERFFLFAGVLKERKNVAGIIRAFSLFSKEVAGHELLIAGKQSGGYEEFLVRLARDLGVAERIRFLGYVSDAELSYLYTKAEALIFPSLIEGFGMPVLEAMHAGLPVITSRQGALAEVADAAALLVDPTRPDDIAGAMARVAKDSELRESLRAKGKARAALFSWDETARRVLEVLRDLEHTGSKN